MARFVLRQHLGNHMGNAQLFLNGGSCAGIIARQHRHLNAHILQFAHSLYAGFFQGIRHGHNAGKRAVLGKQQRRFSVFRQGVYGLLPFPGQFHTGLGQQGRVTRQAGLAGQPGLHALAKHRRKALYLRGLHALLFGMGQHGPGQRMFAGLFQAGRQMQQRRFIKPLRRQKVCHHRLTVCKGAGFIQHHGVHRMGCFQRLARFDKNAVFGALASAHHNRHRCGKAQCARARHHQHCNANGNCKFCRLPHSQPHKGGHKRNGNYHRHKHPGYFIGQFGNRRLAGACLFHQADNLGKRGVLPHLGCTEPERTGGVDAGRKHCAAGALFHRDALARDGGLVHAGGALCHHAVHRDALARFHRNDIPCLHLFHRHGMLFTAAHHRSCFRGKANQLFNGFAGFPFAFGLQVFAQRNKCQNHGGRLEIQVHMILVRQRQVVYAQAIPNAHNGKNTVCKGRRRANGNQAVHIGA